MASVTLQLASFVRSFDASSLPEEAIRRSKLAVLDCIGVALAGTREAPATALREYVKSAASRPEATIWGTDCKVSCMEAALVNGTTAHALDYDDCNRSMLGHPSVVLVPVVFALGEKLRCPGRKALEAYVVGFEVMAILGRILHPGLYEKGWHPTSVLGTIGACASASYLVGLSLEQTVSAIGVAASEASGIKKNFGSMTKPLHAGSAARKGIWAALLAQGGFTADAEALDGTFGFLELFRGDMRYDLTPLEDLGRSLEIVSSGLVIKRYPCCGSIHPSLDCLVDLVQKESLSSEDVLEIECKINPRPIPHIDRPRVQTGSEGKFSVQYCMAVALVSGRVGLAHFSEEQVRRPGIQDLMNKVRIVPEVAMGEFAAEVTVRTRDGRSFTRFVPEAKGSPVLPLSEDEVLQKFLDCASVVLTASRAEEAARAIMALEGEPNLDKVVKTLFPG